MKRVLVIGTGSIGERHVRCFGLTGRARLSICEVNDKLRQAVAERYQVDASFDNLQRALEDPPDAAVICTPAHLHVAMACQLAAAGIPLLVEKPLSTNFSGVAELEDLVAARQLVVGVAYVMRMNRPLAQMRREVAAGRFGEPVELVVVSGQHFPTYRPAYRSTYYTDRATGGGAIQDSLTHLVNAAEWLVGPATVVAADAARQVLDGVDVEDTVHVMARHGTLPASYSLNQHQAPNETSLRLVCREGTVQWQSQRGRWVWMTEPGADWKLGSEEANERDTGFVNQAEMFLDAVEQRRPPVCELSEGIQTLCTNLAILKAADTRSWQTVARPTAAD